ncbi:MAG: hypothetical protein Q8L72_05125 [Moraxellaceae bacterium]|nr:hypothetical protein [Moraxellaceae bacterium]
MKGLALAVIAALISGCAGIQSSTRVDSQIKAFEFNSLASQYMQRPTHSSIETMSTGSSVLLLEMDKYGTGTSQIRFDKAHVESYVALIDKFKAWESLAKARQDALTKEIGRARTWSNIGTGELKFVFHSGNQNSHYLAISFCTVGTCLDDQALYLDLPNANRLTLTLQQLESGQLKHTNVDAIYK